MDPDERAFQALYGRVQPWSLAMTAERLRGLPWWVCGGWALELATGISRAHHDLDVAVPRHDLGRIAAQLIDHHLWVAQDGSLTPLPRFDSLPDDHEQLWVRRDADSPWVLDLLLQPVDGDTWVFKKDGRVRVPMAEAVLTTDGIPYLAPQIALLHKAHLRRPKDEFDLAATLPVLSEPARRWLGDVLELAQPGNPWLDRVRSD